MYLPVRYPIPCIWVIEYSQKRVNALLSTDLALSLLHSAVTDGPRLVKVTNGVTIVHNKYVSRNQLLARYVSK